MRNKKSTRAKLGSLELPELEILDEEIDGEISAEKTRNVDINFRQAMLLLENYSGVKAAGTYNKKPEFY